MISNFIIFLLLFNCLNCSIEKSDLAIGFIILSQPNEYHKSLAEQLKVNILNQAKELHCEHKIKIYKSHEDFGNVLGHWTIQPLFKKLSKLENLDWMFFLEDQTHISVKEIFKIMLSYNSSQNIFVGYALKDSDPTIIHHFAATDENSVISYPHFSAGFFMSFSLISKLIMECKDCQFSIDPKYELAKFIWDNSATKLIHEPQLCLKKNLDICATWITENIPNCGHAIPAKKIFVAVKTCTKFHKDRVKVFEKHLGS
ncbi:beta-1,3-glucosyltransferase [Caerostris extrusa]|uniref:Beta-1,3-glucosyltransferase n=1 Tax=Caerostris extrusa TaxID=172846 RepID=A0AAV4PWG5_CAEEX|nr:beta-1,3-glucosyltransferase [Caerostris extrusa]